ncbi:siderophore biosynthesis protein PsvB [Vibrio alginolyticus]|uniref:Siderophore biosynthesis protein PsvB n=1 Tax=Vibrio alginolyticus TaxID=663 RepID=A0A7Y0MU42_VIBAL|nr:MULTISPECIES: IucA/IucC family protein [Vibrio]MBS9996352.1 siderophore biosynthesis protein PsvB [Vibrio alginolyticus]MCS0286120.1 siderophore biosynthesis protein PsvB [Vibrio alginolyticus]MDW1833802.1 IucA/IucC family protein [Vibrio sp. Vb0718]MDW2201241.1 IucA/IucC family protein [Vibrio sp. 1636]NMR73196.1 siderophore biosynthesis protein PsvB [Vibrio alginolyticus]
MNDNALYLTQRLIDTCLREDMFGILSKAKFSRDAPKGVIVPQDEQVWLIFANSDFTLYLPVAPTYYMQHWRYGHANDETPPGWWVEKNGQVEHQQHYKEWIALLTTLAHESSHELLAGYLQELECAEKHKALCDQAFHHHADHISQPISELGSWHQKLLLADQIASYLDHPYYPTARAKFGLSDEDLAKYAPEFAQSFALHWIAIEKSLVTLTSGQPDCWPTMEQVGLPADFALSHVLFPAHPLTLRSLEALPEGVIEAPLTYLDVTPTLSVRTVVVNEAPHIHIKVPLIMRSLGTKNIRLIKPSTLYDGHWFERLLSHLEQTDADLNSRLFHCNEKHGGHIGEDKTFAYIVREYPLTHCEDKALVPVAALASPMPDDRLFLEHLAEHYYQQDTLAWFQDYVDLLCQVHLTLWLRYGIALESNQQNAIVAFDQQGRMTLAMKDNDAARVWPERFRFATDHAAEKHGAKTIPVDCDELLDQRIKVDNELALGQMFTTITLQLDIAAIVEAMAAKGIASSASLYAIVAKSIAEQLNRLEGEGLETKLARELLQEAPDLYAKYLLSSGSLLSKEASGASDINKFYGLSAPNFLLLSSEEAQRAYLEAIKKSVR